MNFQQESQDSCTEWRGATVGPSQHGSTGAGRGHGTGV